MEDMAGLRDPGNLCSVKNTYFLVGASLVDRKGFQRFCGPMAHMFLVFVIDVVRAHLNNETRVEINMSPESVEIRPFLGLGRGLWLGLP